MAIVTNFYRYPVSEPAKHALEALLWLVKALFMSDNFVAWLSTWDAVTNRLVCEDLPIPILIFASICKSPAVHC